MRDTWKSRSTFLLAAIGSAVGLGNAWRFPGLASKHGGGAFLLVYLIALMSVGIPMLMAEIAIGRKVRRGAPGSMQALHPKAEPIGWMGVANGFFIQIYYAAVFAWVILMFFMSWKFAGLTGNPTEASQLWATTISTTGTTSGFTTVSWPMLGCLLLGWAVCFLCIRNGTASVSKVIKYIVCLPVICLLILAVRGFTLPGAGEGLIKLFVPDWSALSDSTLWIDAFGQVFYSMSVSMGIMFAYGSFVREDANIAVDSLIVAGSDLLVSIISSVVMFTTMAGVGMLGKMTDSGISTAFIVYPQAIVMLSDIPWLNALFGYVFYFCLITLAIDSVFSIVEGVSTAVSDKFSLKKKHTTRVLCLISLVLGLVYITGGGLAILDIVDYAINNYALLLTGVAQAATIGWCFKTARVTEEINRNGKSFRMSDTWMKISLKYVAPGMLFAVFAWNLVTLFTGGGVYGAEDGYSVAANLVMGWGVVILILLSGLIIKAVAKARAKKGFPEEQITWEGGHKTEEAVNEAE